MNVIGIVDNTTKDDNSHTLVKVALKYIQTFKYDTRIISADDFDFSKANPNSDKLKADLEGADALILATSANFPEATTDIDPFLQWVDRKGVDLTDKPVGAMLLIEPRDSIKDIDEDILVKHVKGWKANVVSEVKFTKVAEDNDARSNTYVLTEAMRCGEDIGKYLKKLDK